MIVSREDFTLALWELIEEGQEGYSDVENHARNWQPHARRTAVALRRKLKEIDKVLEIYAIESFKK